MRILIIEMSNLGDALLTYPALHALWRAYPDGEFHLLASPRNAELFLNDPRVKEVRIWDKKAGPLRQLQMVRDLSRERFDWVVDFRNSLVPFFLPGAKRTPLFGRSSRNGTHRAQAHMDLVTALGVPPYTGAMRLPFESEEEQEVAKWLEPGKRTVLIVPGARSHLKRWPLEKFAAVADRLVEKHQAQVLLVGEEAEQPIAEQVRRLMKQPAVNLAGRGSIRQLAALLAQTQLVVTNDSACLHAAEVMGVPSVAIFGPTDERKYGPRNPRSAVVRLKLRCAPCEKALCRYGTHECMRDLAVDDVYSAAVKVLETSVRAEPVEARIGKA